MFPRRIRDYVRVMGVQLARYLDGLVSLRASFRWPCKRRKTQEFVFVYLHLLFSTPFFHSL